MAKKETNDPPNLISLPLDVLSHLSHFLGPQNLLVLSATCRYLRSAFNDDWYWRKYTHGGHVSEALDATTSLVEPLFTNPQTVDSLEPLCQHRLHFLKQSRLLSNLREGKYVKHSIDYEGPDSFLGPPDDVFQQTIYKGIYLFTIDYLNETRIEQAVKVFNIDRKPFLVSTFKLLNHEEKYIILSHAYKFKIVGDKLVVVYCNWVDVYQIKMPLENFDVLYSININTTPVVTHHTHIVGNCLLVDRGPSNLHTWDIDSGEKLGTMNPTNEQKANVLSYSEDRKHILFYIQHPENANNKQDLNFYAYDILLQKFNYFSVQPSRFLYNLENLVGLIDSTYVVLFCQNGRDLGDNEFSITVYNYIDSNLVVQSKYIKASQLRHAKIVKSLYLLLPFFMRIKVKQISTLNIIWEVYLDRDLHEVDLVYGLEYINRSNLCEMLIVHKGFERELWVLERRKEIVKWDILLGQMLLRVGNNFSLEINMHFSKIIACSNCILSVYSFW